MKIIFFKKVVERSIFLRRGVVKHFGEFRSDYVGMSNDIYSLNLYRRKSEVFYIMFGSVELSGPLALKGFLSDRLECMTHKIVLLKKKYYNEL